jgi:hypothetical protein
MGTIRMDLSEAQESLGQVNLLDMFSVFKSHYGRCYLTSIRTRPLMQAEESFHMPRYITPLGTHVNLW